MQLLYFFFCDNLRLRYLHIAGSVHCVIYMFLYALAMFFTCRCSIIRKKNTSVRESQEHNTKNHTRLPLTVVAYFIDVNLAQPSSTASKSTLNISPGTMAANTGRNSAKDKA